MNLICFSNLICPQCDSESYEISQNLVIYISNYLNGKRCKRVSVEREGGKLGNFVFAQIHHDILLLCRTHHTINVADVLLYPLHIHAFPVSETQKTKPTTMGSSLTHLTLTFGFGMSFFIVWILADHRNLLQLYTQTCKHHHVLEVGADLVFTAQVQQEGEGVDVRCPAQKHSQLGEEESRHDCKNGATAALTASRPSLDILSLLRASEGSVHEKVVLGH